MKSLIGNGNVLLQSPHLEGLFGQSKKFKKETALKLMPAWFKGNPVPRIYLDLKALLNT